MGDHATRQEALLDTNGKSMEAKSFGSPEVSRAIAVSAILLVLGWAGCSGSGYHVKTERLSGVDCEIRDYHECFGDDCRTFSASPVFQEIDFNGSIYHFDGSKVYVRDVFIAGNDAFVLVRNNFGHYIARLCEEGHLEYAADLLETPVGSDFSVSVRKEDRDFVFSVEQSHAEESDGRTLLEKKVFSGRIFGGCSSIFDSTQ